MEVICLILGPMLASQASIVFFSEWCEYFL